MLSSIFLSRKPKKGHRLIREGRREKGNRLEIPNLGLALVQYRNQDDQIQRLLVFGIVIKSGDPNHNQTFHNQRSKSKMRDWMLNENQVQVGGGHPPLISREILLLRTSGTSTLSNQRLVGLFRHTILTTHTGMNPFRMVEGKVLEQRNAPRRRLTPTTTTLSLKTRDRNLTMEVTSQMNSRSRSSWMKNLRIK